MGTEQKKILLGQLAAHGDCLYATAVAKQIKKDYPGCHLTWAISPACAPLLANNPHVDAVWRVDFSYTERPKERWAEFKAEAERRKNNGEFDEIFLTQIYPGLFEHYDGTIRASIFRGYPKPIDVPIAPVVQLTAEEIAEVKAFAEKHQLKARPKVILFEFAHNSAQSFIDLDFALAVAHQVIVRWPKTAVVLSSHLPIGFSHPDILDGSVLSFRENAELTHYCDLLLGCSSGISWLATSEWARPLPTLQLLKKDQSIYASMGHDFNYFGLDRNHLIEMTECTPAHVVDCIATLFSEGLAVAHKQFHEEIPLNFDYYFSILNQILRPESMDSYCTSILRTFERYGFDFLKSFIQHYAQMAQGSYRSLADLRNENTMLYQTCEERLKVIHILNDRVQFLEHPYRLSNMMKACVRAFRRKFTR